MIKTLTTTLAAVAAIAVAAVAAPPHAEARGRGGGDRSRCDRALPPGDHRWRPLVVLLLRRRIRVRAHMAAAHTMQPQRLPRAS